MANDSKTLFQVFTKRGMGENDATFAVIDHWNRLHWEDRNRYGALMKALKDENAELKERVAALEAR